MGPMFTGTGRDRDRASRDRDGSGTAACGNGRERDWKTSPVQHSSSNDSVASMFASMNPICRKTGDP